MSARRDADSTGNSLRCFKLIDVGGPILMWEAFLGSRGLDWTEKKEMRKQAEVQPSSLSASWLQVPCDPDQSPC